MLVFPGMIAEAAKIAGMAVPESPDDEDSWTAKEFPHFMAFCNLQLARPMNSPSEHWENAHIIAPIPVEKLKRMTLQDFLALGLRFAS